MGLWNACGQVSSSSGSRSRQHLSMSAVCFVLVLILLAAGAPIASARVHASILVDVQTGKVLEAHNPDARCYPASLAKLMTLYITFQQLRAGKLTLAQELPVSSHAAAQQPTKLYLRPGERISVRSAILAITTRSANDAAVVLAEGIGGSEWKFAQMMNQRARELGMVRTTFRNASGLPNRYQKTTARDMSKLAIAILQDFPQYYYFFKARSFDFRGKMIYGHDHLLARYPGVDGMKTGYTNASGFNIVTSAVRYHCRLLGVVMGGRTARLRDRRMIALLNRGFARVRAGTVAASTQGKNSATPEVARYKSVTDQDGEEAQAARPDLGWLVQIGGRFRSRRYTRGALRSAVHTAPEPLEDARPIVVKLRGAGYLARFADMTEGSAMDACRQLRRRRFTCKAYQVRPSGLALVSERQ